MSTMLEKVNYISGIKDNIAKAITDKGGTVTNDFDSYATAITNLPSGGGSCTAGVCFDDAGYDFNELCLVKMRNDLKYTKQKFDEWDPSRTSANGLYGDDKNLLYAPKIDTSKVTNMISMFHGCSSLTSVPLFDTSKVTDMCHMFYQCNSLTSVPLFNTSKVTTMEEMFDGCKSLTSVPQFETSKVTNMSYMFKYCSSLTSVPQFDTSKVTDMRHMFLSCSSLTSVPQFDTSKVTDMDSMFSSCTSLKEIPAFNTDLVTYFSEFNGWGMRFIKVGGLSLKSATDLSNTFSAWNDSPVQYMLLKDLGTPESVTEYDFSKQANWGLETPNSEYPDIDVTGASQTVVDSLLTYSFDRKTAGYAVCNLKCHANMKQYLTEEQITAIQNKGYTITFG